MRFHGTVVSGNQVGRAFGIATANIACNPLPDMDEGVYLVDVMWDGGDGEGLLHFGRRKTFGEDMSVEVHLLDCNKDLYGKNLAITVLRHLRAVQAFANADALYTQIEQDIVQARKYFLRREVRRMWDKTTDSEKDRLGQAAAEKLLEDEGFMNARTVYMYHPDRRCEIDFLTPLLRAGASLPDMAFPRVTGDSMTFHICAPEALVPGMHTIPEPPAGLPPASAVNIIPGEGIIEPTCRASEVPAEVHNMREGRQVQDIVLGEKEMIEPMCRASEVPAEVHNMREGRQVQDIVLVPAVAVGRNGARLGRGGGFYDRFLATNKAPTVSIVPTWALVEAVPVLPHDQKVDRVMVVE